MVLGHALGYLVAAVLQAVAALGLVAGLTRLLSEVEFGQYGLAAAVLHLYQSIVFFWLRASVSRFHAQTEQDGRLPAFLGHVRWWFVVAGLVAGAVAVLAALLLPISPGLRATMLAALIAATAQGGFTLVLELHRATLRAWRYSLFQSLQAGLSLALSLAFVLAAGQAAGSYGAALAMLGLGASYLVCLLADARGLAFWRAASPGADPRVGPMLAYGLPLSIAMVLDAVFATGDRFVIAHYLGEAEVGPYAAAVTLAHRSLLAICGVVGAAAAPLAFAALAGGGVPAARARLGDAVDLLYAIAIPAAAGLGALARPVAQVMVAEPMRAEVAMLLPWIACGALMHGIAVHYFHQAFLLARRPAAMIATIVPVVAIYLLLNLLLVARFGPFGAALAMIATQAIHLTVVTVIGRQQFPMPWRGTSALKAACATALMLAALRWTPMPGGAPGLVAQILFGAAVYGVAALVLDLAQCRQRLGRYLRREA